MYDERAIPIPNPRGDLRRSRIRRHGERGSHGQARQRQETRPQGQGQARRQTGREKAEPEAGKGAVEKTLAKGKGKGAVAKAKASKGTTKPKAKAEPKAKASKPAKAKPEGGKPGGSVSQLDAAAAILAKHGKAEGMTCPAMVEKMIAEKLWKPGTGKTPAATLSAAIIKNIAAKGKESRFRKVSAGHYALNA